MGAAAMIGLSYIKGLHIGSQMDDLRGGGMIHPPQIRYLALHIRKSIDKCRKLDPLQAAAIPLGVVGAIATAGATDLERLAGFCVWVIANICWIISARRDGDYYHGTYFLIMLGTAIMGILHNLPGVA